MGEISGKYYAWSEDDTKKIAEEPGVYAFYDEDGVLIYIGSTSNLRERFRYYWTTNFEEDPCKRDTRKYKREFTSNYEAREKELLEQYEREHGRLPRCNEKVT
jgi:excinuclease UvrABC nuclease subunit